jgi:peptidoglycan/xylan/chitin deacetylase (PgdA/CDA1 family)
MTSGNRDRLVVLQHHRVGLPPPEARYRRMFVSPALLSFQVWLLRRAGYEFYTLREALGRTGLRAVVTFDDGVLDNIELGFPVLCGLGVPATVFVVSADVGKRQISWAESGERLAADLLGWDDLGRLVNHGWEVGSHGHWHENLDRQPAARQAENLQRGRATITRHLGVAPSSLSYPYGAFTDETIGVAEAAGFSCAVTTARGANASGAHPFRLRRWPAGGRRPHHYLLVLGALG